MCLKDKQFTETELLQQELKLAISRSKSTDLESLALIIDIKNKIWKIWT